MKRTSGIRSSAFQLEGRDAHRMRALRLTRLVSDAKRSVFPRCWPACATWRRKWRRRRRRRRPQDTRSFEKSTMRSAVDTLTDVQDIRTARMRRKGYIGADDYYLQLEARDLLRSWCGSSALKEFVVWPLSGPTPAARVAPFPIESLPCTTLRPPTNCPGRPSVHR